MVVLPIDCPRHDEPISPVVTDRAESTDGTQRTEKTVRVELKSRTQRVQSVPWATWAERTKVTQWLGRSKCRVGHGLEELGCPKGRHDLTAGAVTAEAAVGGKRMGLKRLETPRFQQYRNTEAAGREVWPGRMKERAWNKMAIVRIQRPKKEPKVR